MTQGFVNPYTYAVSAPTVTVLTSGSGTYTVPAGVQFLIVELIGGGGGGGGGGVSGTPGPGSAGANTTFGALTGNGGSNGATYPNNGGSASGGNILNMTGNSGSSRGANGSAFGGIGGAGINGGCASGGDNGGAPGNIGGTATANSGAGGGGGGNGAGGGGDTAGGGGGAGGYVKHVYTSPSATYSYSVGAGGAGGAAGTSGGAGGAGGSGVIYVYEYYQTLGIPTSLTLPLPVAFGGTGVANDNWTAGSLTFSPSTQGIVGTTAGDNAAAGYVGQAPASYVSSGAPVVITSAVQTNITSLSFDAGDYDVYFQLGFVPANTAVLTLAYAGISTTSATLPSTTAPHGFASWFGSFTGDGSSQVVLNGYARYSFATTTTVYLVGFTSCTGNTNGFGGIAARRAR